MIGPILLALSWILLRLEGKGLGVLVAGLAVVVQQLFRG